MPFGKDPNPLTPEQVEKSEWNRAMNMPMAGEQPPLPWLPQQERPNALVEAITNALGMGEKPIEYGTPERMESPEGRGGETVVPKSSPAVAHPGGADSASDPNQTSRPRQSMAPKVQSPVSKAANKMKKKAGVYNAMADWIAAETDSQ